MDVFIQCPYCDRMLLRDIRDVMAVGTFYCECQDNGFKVKLKMEIEKDIENPWQIAPLPHEQVKESQSEKMLSCPFCGSRFVELHILEPHNPECKDKYVACMDCGAEGPLEDCYDGDLPAIEAWNKRSGK